MYSQSNGYWLSWDSIVIHCVTADLDPFCGSRFTSSPVSQYFVGRFLHDYLELLLVLGVK
jgi:hypothetical protein